MTVFRTEVIGRLGGDPEKRTTQSGDEVTSFSLAVDTGTKEKPHTTWIKCSAWNKLADICNQYLEKGKQVYVEGKIRSGHYSHKETGDVIDTLELTVYQMTMLGSKSEGDDEKPRRANNDDDDGLPF